MEIGAAQSLCQQRHDANHVPWLGCWISNPRVTCSKPVDGCKSNSVFHPLEIDQINNRIPRQ